MLRIRPSDRMGLAIVIGASLALQAPIYDHWVSLMDEGFVLQTAAEVMRGKLLYRDVIIPNPMPLSFYLLAGVFTLFGPTIQVARLVVVAMFAVMSVCVYRLTRRVLSPASATAAGLLFVGYRLWAFPHWHMVSYSTFAIFFATLAVTVLAGGLPVPSLERLAVTGGLAGLAVLSKQDSGAAIGLGLAALVLLYPPVAGRARGGLALAGGGVAVVLPALLFFAAQGALGDLWVQTVLTPLEGVRTFDYPGLPGLLPLFTQDPDFREHVGGYFPAILMTLYWDAISLGETWRTSGRWDTAVKLVYYLPFVALAAATIGTWRLRTRLDDRTRAGRALLLVLAAVCLLAFNKPRDWVHLMVLFYPTLILAVVVAADVLGALPNRGRLLGGALAWLVVGAILASSAKLAADLRRQTGYEVSVPGGRLHVTPDEALVFSDLARFVQQTVPADAPLPVFPYHPLVQFMLGRDSGTRSYIIWPVRPYPDIDARLIADLERDHAHTIIYSLSQYGHLHRFQANAPDLFAYLLDHYAMVRVFTARTWGLVFTALARRPPAPPRPPDAYVFAKHLDDAVLTVTPPAESARIVAAGERAEWVAQVLWPFRRVVALRPVRAPGETALHFMVRVPPLGRLHLAYGMNPDHWLTFTPSALTFTVTLRDADGTTATLLRDRLDPQRNIVERAWRELAVELAAYAGHTIDIAFAVSTENAAGEVLDLAGFADLRLVGTSPTPTP